MDNRIQGEENNLANAVLHQLNKFPSLSKIA
jgi:hypothetical protein